MKNKLLELGFIDNEYLSKYLDLIEKNRNNPKIKGQTQGHHIVPVCVFVFNKLKVDNTKQNMVNLFYKEHILAHYYLCLCCDKGQLKHRLRKAFLYLVNCKYDLGTFDPKTDLDGFQNLYNEHISELSKKYLGTGICKDKRTCFKPGHMPSELNRRITSERMKGKPRTAEEKEKISLAHKGKHLNPANEFKKGHIVTPEMREKLRKASLGQISSQRIKVLQYDFQGNFIKEWASATEPEKVLGIGQPHIIQCCKRKRNYAGGFMWRYKNGLIQEHIDPICLENAKKPVLQYDLNGNILNEYESARKASRQTEIGRSSIRRCCDGEQKTAGGFIWKYK